MTTADTYTYDIGLFEKTGVELEYMIVDADTLDVRPISDELLKAQTGGYNSDAEPDGPEGVIGWSNELVMHVIELKTIDPVASLDGLPALFNDHIHRVAALLKPMGARLLPTAMHPWMDPNREMHLWPHDYNPVYEAFDRIFSRKGHGWANLQSTHINLPFSNDLEFARLHAAIRPVLPLLPALAASSPIVGGRMSTERDARLDAYRRNARRIPSVCGRVIPEPVFTRNEYEQSLLAGIYRDLAPHDPDGVLQHEWANARGCIARFDRGSIEIRVLDIQECPSADVAIAALVTAVVEAVSQERWLSLKQLMALEVEPLFNTLLATIHDAEDGLIDDPSLLSAFGHKSPLRAGELWQSLLESCLPDHPVFTPLLQRMNALGTLSSRIVRSLPAESADAPSRDELKSVYRSLADCLMRDALYEP